MYIFEGKYVGNSLLLKNFFDMLLQLHPVTIGSSSFIRQSYFKIHEKGMQIYSTVENSPIWILATFNSSGFEYFKLKENEINVSTNLELIKNFFKNIKKNDAIIFKIKFDEYNSNYEMEMEIVKKNEKIKLTNTINLNKIQSITIDVEDRLSNNVAIFKSCEFATLFKNINNVNTIEVCFNLQNSKFIFNNNDISKTVVILGEDFENENYIFSDTFNAVYFKHINKISTFGNFLKMYAMKKQPLIFETEMENIGNIKIWIKSNSVILKENLYN